MNQEEFQQLPVERVAQLVHSAGPKVCVFPINGTRRWFLLEHGLEKSGNLMSNYLDIAATRHVEIYQLLFSHGIGTLLAPIFGPDLMERDEQYVHMAADGLARLVQHPTFTQFYARSKVRVRFYGDYCEHFRGTPYAFLIELFHELEQQTAGNDAHRLFFGVFAHDASVTVGRIAVAYYLEHNTIPDKGTLIELYYGERVGPVDLFIGFDKPSVFDMPLVSTGNEDLYFTTSPSLYLTERQLRNILYDHLYSRRESETDYGLLEEEDWELMKEFYRLNIGNTLGVGVKHHRTGGWYPLPQVVLPTPFLTSLSENQPGPGV